MLANARQRSGKAAALRKRYHAAHATVDVPGDDARALTGRPRVDGGARDGGLTRPERSAFESRARSLRPCDPRFPSRTRDPARPTGQSAGRASRRHARKTGSAPRQGYGRSDSRPGEPRHRDDRARRRPGEPRRRASSRESTAWRAAPTVERGLPGVRPTRPGLGRAAPGLRRSVVAPLARPARAPATPTGATARRRRRAGSRSSRSGASRRRAGERSKSSPWRENGISGEAERGPHRKGGGAGGAEGGSRGGAERLE